MGTKSNVERPDFRVIEKCNAGTTIGAKRNEIGYVQCRTAIRGCIIILQIAKEILFGKISL